MGSSYLVIKKYGFLGLSHFTLLKKLGSGDIGTVYLAELIGTGCLFAIKVMGNEFLAKRKKTARALTERVILRMLDHPFLPALYAQFTSDNLSCLVMEFCPGGDLHVLRQKQTSLYFSEHAARFYVAEVLLPLNTYTCSELSTQTSSPKTSWFVKTATSCSPISTFLSDVRSIRPLSSHLLRQPSIHPEFRALARGPTA